MKIKAWFSSFWENLTNWGKHMYIPNAKYLWSWKTFFIISYKNFTAKLINGK